MDFRGEISHNIINDTIILKYRLKPIRLAPDSIFIQIEHDSSAMKWVQIYKKELDGGRITLSDPPEETLEGTIIVPYSDKSLDRLCARIIGYAGSGDSLQEITKRYRFSPPLLTRTIELPFAVSYWKSSLPGDQERDDFQVGWGAGIHLNMPKSRFEISTLWNWEKGRFNFSDPIRVGYRYYTGTRENFMPALIAACKISRINIADDNSQYFRSDFGAEGGIAFEGEFERASYVYSTGLGGFHTWQLYLAAISGTNYKVGTKYTFQKADKFWMVRVSFCYEGVHGDHYNNTYIQREYQRSLPQRILAWTGAGPPALLYFPIMVVFKFLGSLGR